MPMNPDFDHLLQKIFRAGRLEETDVLNMEQLAGEYPYFAPLQYLLAKKYRQLNYEAYKSQITKTAIFFSNPHWLNDLLLSDEEADLKDEDTGEHIVEEQTLHIPPSEPNVAVSVPEVVSEENNIVLPDDVTRQENNKYFDTALQQPVVNEDNHGNDSEHVFPLAGTEEEQPPAAQPEPGDDEQIPFQPEPEEVLSDMLWEEDDAVLPELSTQSGEIIPAGFQEDSYSNIPETFPENTAGQELGQNAEPIENKPGLSEDGEDQKTIVAVSDAVAEETPSAALQQEEPANTESPDIEKSREVSPEKSTLPSQLIKPGSLSLPDAGSLPLIPIEPLYAVDYFASQGIKLSNEEGKDKLSQKLRSFTEWLKTMKRIHPEKLEQEMDTRTSTVIQHIAEHSNELEDVVTEAMAEVYARQGLRNKAAEVYQKLSLLNPDKRAYFAARISKLNET